ncbi:hypothetical protein LTR84_010690 [Exophiala bonariae]|uniref:Chromatin assembly factor 1 subunit A n=1 Tax=Exophiala bonariae TaxID=1690606 RepID=A0AAV9MSW5_9EURO|nr:hypothetical protein LTR84_010690 [Exophiala bonariae]
METQSLPSLALPAETAEQVTPSSKKRNYEGTLVSQANSLIPPLDQQDLSSVDFSRADSPLTELGATPAVSPQREDMAPESKKRKLTFAEREVEKAVKKTEKEEKEKLKAEAKAKKDEEKKRKDEEREATRAAKDAVKAERQKAKDAVQQEKDAEKARKEAEALKKQKNQLRIGAFFGRPALASTPPTTPDDVSLGASSRRSSIASIDMAPSLIANSPVPKSKSTEYDQWILPFFVNEHTEVAPANRFHYKTSSFSKELLMNQSISPENISTRFEQRRRSRKIKSVKEIVEKSDLSSKESIDLIGFNDDLESIPYKCLFFYHDVRPAYQGTYTRFVSPQSSRKIARNPTYRGLPDTNYDYDSEAEWQEPEEGDDDLMDEDELSEDDAGEEEMDDFVDDDGEPVKRRLIMTDMEPRSTGLCWEDAGSPSAIESDLSSYRLDVLHDSVTLPIDPYSTAHWSDIGKTSPKKRPLNSPAGMQPPRVPLMTLDNNTASLAPPPPVTGYPIVYDQSNVKKALSKTKGAHAASGKPVKTIPSDLLPAFKTAVEDSTLSKVGLIEVLKNQFPKCSKEAIKDTLSNIAVRNSSEKKWVLI